MLTYFGTYPYNRQIKNSSDIEWKARGFIEIFSTNISYLYRSNKLVFWVVQTAPTSVKMFELFFVANYIGAVVFYDAHAERVKLSAILLLNLLGFDIL